MSLETFFQGRAAFFSRLSDIQEHFVAELPSLWVPNTSGSSTLKPYHLRSADNTESLAIGVNQATWISFRYPGFQVFFRRALPALARTLEFLGVDQLERVMYRYENELAIGRGPGSLALERILTLQLPDGGDASNLHNVNLDWTRAWDRGATGIHVWTETDGRRELLKLTVVACLSPAGGAANLPQAASTAHDKAIELFEGMITQGFREYIQSGKVPG